MSSTESTPALPDVSAIVVSDDPKVNQLAQRLLSMDDDSLCTLTGEAKALIARRRQEVEQEIAGDVMLATIAERVLLKRIVDAGGRAIAHDHYKVEIVARKEIERRIDVLRQLEKRVPAQELAAALYLTQPKPEWKADVTKLRALQRKYGGDSEIGRIIDEGLVETYSAPRLLFEPREPMQSVTTLKAVS